MRTVIALLFCLSPFGAVAQLATPAESDTKPYRTTLWVDGGIILGSLGYYGGISLYDATLPLPTEAEVLALDPLQINAFDRGATQNLSTSINTLSDVGMYTGMVSPFLLLLDPAIRKDGWQVAVMGVETLAVSTALTFTAKVFTRRYRPYMYNPDYPLADKLDNTDGLHSFYSGHTSASACMSFYTAKVFNDYHPDSPWRYVVWAGAATVPAITGWARVGAGKHFATDVIVGYAAGALVGYFVPELHRLWQQKHTMRQVPRGE